MKRIAPFLLICASTLSAQSPVRPAAKPGGEPWDFHAVSGFTKVFIARPMKGFVGMLVNSPGTYLSGPNDTFGAVSVEEWRHLQTLLTKDWKQSTGSSVASYTRFSQLKTNWTAGVIVRRGSRGVLCRFQGSGKVDSAFLKSLQKVANNIQLSARKTK